MDSNKAVPMNAPDPQGKEVDIYMFADNDHAGEKVSHRSGSGFSIHENTALVQ